MSGAIASGGLVFNTPAQIAGGSTGRFAGIDQPTLLAWRTAAQTAAHQVAIGGKAVVMMYNQGAGARSVEFNRTNIATLNAYIADLNTALGGGAPRSIPIAFT